jgi:alkylation response protein AidB-like acyl-CoA dehydrogenase
MTAAPIAPANYVTRVEALAPLVAQEIDASEREAQLSDAVVEALHEAELFRIMLPESVSGGGLTNLEALPVFEAAGHIDGSMGWNLAIGSDGALLGHWLDEAPFRELFGDSRAVLAGSLNPAGIRVTPTDGGFRVNGTGAFCSGCNQATAFVAAGFALGADGAPQLLNGVPAMRATLFPARNGTIQRNWSVAGLRATGSHDVVFDDVFVPESFSFTIPGQARQEGPRGRVPLPTQLVAPLAAVGLGIARHAIDAFHDLAGTKVPALTRSPLRERVAAQMQLAQAEALLGAARAYFYETQREIWELAASGAPIGLPELARTRLGLVSAARFAVQAVDLIYDAAGTSSNFTRLPIERCWRDIHALSQHVGLASSRYETVGRVLMGLEPGGPIV